MATFADLSAAAVTFKADADADLTKLAALDESTRARIAAEVDEAQKQADVAATVQKLQIDLDQINATAVAVGLTVNVPAPPAPPAGS